MNHFLDEGDFANMNAHRMNSYDAIHYLEPYRKLIKGIKCPVHKRVAKIDQAYKEDQYDDGNYTRLYFSNSCCSGFESHIVKIITTNFVDYESHRVYRHEEV